MPIPRLVKGEPPSMIEADIANSVIDAVNALALMQVQPAELGKAVVTLGPSGRIIIDLSEAKGVIAREAVAIVLHGDGTGGGGAGGGDGGLLDRIRRIEQRLDAASISAECGNDGKITVTLNL